MNAAEKIMNNVSAEDKYSVKTVSKSDDLAVFEVTPTAAEEPHLRLVYDLLYGGHIRYESRREPGGVAWTFGQWADATPVAVPADNQRVVFAMMPFFNRTLPVFEEAFHKPEPRFTPYPTVPQDPWRFSVRFEPPKKSMVLEMAFPLGAWLKSALDHPEILRRLEALKAPAAPATPPSDL